MEENRYIVKLVSRVMGIGYVDRLWQVYAVKPKAWEQYEYIFDTKAEALECRDKLNKLLKTSDGHPQD